MNQKGLLLVFCTSVISGFSIFLNKFAVSGIDSSVFTFAKNLLVAVALVSFLVFLKKDSFKVLSGRDWAWLAVIGLVGGSIPFLLFFRGLQLVSGPMGAFIHKTMFIYVAVLAFFMLKERIRPSFLVGGLLLLSGNFLVLKMSGLTFGQGEFLVIGATLLWALENTLSKHVLKRLDGTVVAAGRMGFGALFIFGFLFYSGKASLVGQVSLAQAGWILLTSLLLLGYVATWYNGLKLVDVSVATTVLLIGSPITTALSLVFSGSALSAYELVGTGLIVAGVVLAARIYKFRLGTWSPQA
ncbi:DMT family transporter [Candidatus Woesearchaeota archaeon]|nr:DMT family transporter [Candidatus Woesearchaeota archaeon]